MAGALASQLRRRTGEIGAGVSDRGRGFRLAQIQLADARCTERRGVGASQRKIRNRGVSRPELVGELAAEGAVVHVPPSRIRFQIVDEWRAGEDWERKLGESLVGTEPARGGCEV